MPESPAWAANLLTGLQLARAGEVADFDALKSRLKADGFRAVDALLSPRSIQRHLQAICAARSGAPSTSKQ